MPRETEEIVGCSGAGVPYARLSGHWLWFALWKALLPILLGAGWGAEFEEDETTPYLKVFFPFCEY